MHSAEDYIESVFSPQDAELKEIIQRIESHTDPIQIDSITGKILQFLIKLGGIKKIVEIGTLAGYSTTWMARALPQDGHIWTIEMDEARHSLATETFTNSPFKKHITLVHDTAKKALPELTALGPFDMVFIDANKALYEEFLDWAEANTRTGGLIVADNTLLFGAVYQNTLPDRVRESTKKTMLSFNKRLANPEKYCGILLPTGQGLTVAMKNF